ncbi:MAG TPA: 50S ribosomal protein L18 [Candidatus Paceibacterota bacterium]|nr:50S ribosomal protein L18 [Candidatus Paceibacterota bacterium]
MKNQNKRARIKKRIRAKISGTADRPRLSVFRSNRFIYAQLIDDVAGKTLVSVSDLKLKGVAAKRAKEVGLLLAKSAKAKKLSHIVFDRGGFRFAGRVQALAGGAREGGLQF